MSFSSRGLHLGWSFHLSDYILIIGLLSLLATYVHNIGLNRFLFVVAFSHFLVIFIVICVYIFIHLHDSLNTWSYLVLMDVLYIYLYIIILSVFVIFTLVYIN